MASTSRRTLLAAGGAVAALAALPALAQPTRRLDRIGIQLYTLRDLFAADPMATLARLAAIGYREVEFGGGGYEAMDHAALRRQMDKVGLAAPAIHIPYGALVEKPEAVFAMARTLGAGLVVVPHIDARLRGAAQWAEVVATLDRRGADTARAGLQLAYHNHDFEFTEKHGGRSLFDLLLAGSDPARVAIELDLFWAVHAGEDPLALIRAMPGRVRAYHVKDRDRDGRMVDVGEGVIDFAGIFALNGLAGVRHFFVEHDKAPPPFWPSAETSYTALRALRF
jgi:sugar phosphate isomerase/epimerase